MFRTLSIFFGLIPYMVRSRQWLLLEVLALRQQLTVLKTKHPQPRFAPSDRLFWGVLTRLWSGWKEALVIVRPETVVRWCRAGFKLCWTWLSRPQKPVGRRCVNRELRELIFRIVAENRTWGAPRIYGELRMLGFEISERTVLRWMRKAPRNPEPAKRWVAFLNNLREAIAAMDFFTVPTLTFGMIYCFFVISHDRRRILYCNVTRHPTSAWVTQQWREAFPYNPTERYLVFDRAANFNEEVVSTIKGFGIEPKRTSFRSPGQNGVAERFAGNYRRDLLDHVNVLNERHLKRLMSEYVRLLPRRPNTPRIREADPRRAGGRSSCDPRQPNSLDTEARCPYWVFFL